MENRYEKENTDLSCHFGSIIIGYFLPSRSQAYFLGFVASPFFNVFVTLLFSPSYSHNFIALTNSLNHRTLRLFITFATNRFLSLSPPYSLFPYLFYYRLAICTWAFWAWTAFKTGASQLEFLEAIEAARVISASEYIILGRHWNVYYCVSSSTSLKRVTYEAPMHAIVVTT